MGSRATHKPGTHWRIKAGNREMEQMDLRFDSGPVFDELVVDRWFHIEQMSKNVWWMQVGQDVLVVTVGSDGYAKKVTHYPPGTYANAKPNKKWPLNARTPKC